MKSEYKYYNANPYKQDCNDCTIRALSAFLNIDWEDAYTKLFKTSLELKLQFSHARVVRTMMNELGYEEIEGGVKIKNFSVENKKDYLIWAKQKSKHHLICIKNKILLDSFNPENYESILYWCKKNEE